MSSCAQKPPVRRRLVRAFTLVEIVLVILASGILATIAIPSFIQLQARSKQSEAKANLKALYTAQKAYFQEKDRFSAFVGDIGFKPERNNRYSYYLNGIDAVHITDRSGPTELVHALDTGIGGDIFKYGPGAFIAVPLSCGTQPFVTTDAFLGAAEGNVDADPTVDEWSIASSGGSSTDDSGTAESGTPAGSGVGGVLPAPAPTSSCIVPLPTPANLGPQNSYMQRVLLIANTVLAPFTLGPTPVTNGGDTSVCDITSDVPAGEPANNLDDVNR